MMDVLREERKRIFVKSTNLKDLSSDLFIKAAAAFFQQGAAEALVN